MNGETGKITGVIPISPKRGIINFVLPLIVINVIDLILNMLPHDYMSPNRGSLFILIAFIMINVSLIACAISEYQKLNLIEKKPKVNNYLDDRTIEVRKKINTYSNAHDYSRARTITTTLTFALGSAAILASKNNHK